MAGRVIPPARPRIPRHMHPSGRGTHPTPDGNQPTTPKGTQMSKDYAAEMSAALHEAADFVAAHPDLPAPYITTSFDGTAGVHYMLNIQASDSQPAALVAISRGVGGKWDKNYSDDTLYMRQRIGRLQITASAEREKVCSRRVTGTETVTIPATPARTVEREIVEWDCEPILAGVSA